MPYNKNVLDKGTRGPYRILKHFLSTEVYAASP